RDLGPDDARHDGARRGGVPLVPRGPGGPARRDARGGGDRLTDPFRLDGRVAFVTGAGGGLGEGICTSLAAAGAAVACADIDSGRAERIAERVGGLALEVDVADSASVDVAVARAVSELGGVDVLVNNAAIYPRRAWT